MAKEIKKQSFRAQVVNTITGEIGFTENKKWLLEQSTWIAIDKYADIQIEIVCETMIDKIAELLTKVSDEVKVKIKTKLHEISN